LPGPGQRTSCTHLACMPDGPALCTRLAGGGGGLGRVCQGQGSAHLAHLPDGPALCARLIGGLGRVCQGQGDAHTLHMPALCAAAARSQPARRPASKSSPHLILRPSCLPSTRAGAGGSHPRAAGGGQAPVAAADGRGGGGGAQRGRRPAVGRGEVWPEVRQPQLPGAQRRGGRAVHEVQRLQGAALLLAALPGGAGVGAAVRSAALLGAKCRWGVAARVWRALPC